MLNLFAKTGLHIASCHQRKLHRHGHLMDVLRHCSDGQKLSQQKLTTPQIEACLNVLLDSQMESPAGPKMCLSCYSNSTICLEMSMILSLHMLCKRVSARNLSIIAAGTRSPGAQLVWPPPRGVGWKPRTDGARPSVRGPRATHPCGLWPQGKEGGKAAVQQFMYAFFG